jgi:hypothetical protein
VEASGSAIPERRSPYPGSTIAVAAIATFFFPLFSLVVALVLHGIERDSGKKGMLSNWALASCAWLIAQFLIGFLLFAVGGNGGVGVDQSGPCVGGPVMGASGRDISGNGTKFVLPCSVSGTVTVSSPVDH